MRLGFPDAGNDPPDTMTRQAYDLISEGFGPGRQRPGGDRGRTARPAARGDIDGWRRSCATSTGVAFVATPAINGAGDAALITVIPTTSPQDEATQDLVNRLRDDIVPEALGGTGVTAEVGGVTAALEDQSDYIVGPHAALHRRRRRPLLPAPAGRLPLAVDLAQGRRS